MINRKGKNIYSNENYPSKCPAHKMMSDEIKIRNEKKIKKKRNVTFGR